MVAPVAGGANSCCVQITLAAAAVPQIREGHGGEAARSASTMFKDDACQTHRAAANF